LAAVFGKLGVSTVSSEGFVYQFRTSGPECPIDSFPHISHIEQSVLVIFSSRMLDMLGFKEV
jgi:hypothetical protein